MSRLPAVDRVEVWSILDVSDWLKKIGVDEAGRIAFQDRYIDGVKLLALTENDLSLYAAVKIKQRKLILKNIKELNAASESSNKREKRGGFFNRSRKAPKALPAKSAIDNTAVHAEDSDDSFEDVASPTSRMPLPVPDEGADISDGDDSDSYEEPLTDPPPRMQPVPPSKEGTPPPRPPKPGQSNGAPPVIPRHKVEVKIPSASDDSEDNQDDYIIPSEPPPPVNRPVIASPPPLPIHSPSEIDELPEAPPPRPSVTTHRDIVAPPPLPGGRTPAKPPLAQDKPPGSSPPPLPPSRTPGKNIARDKSPANHGRPSSPALPTARAPMKLPVRTDEPKLPDPPSNPQVPSLPPTRKKRPENKVPQKEEHKEEKSAPSGGPQSIKDRIAQLNNSSHTDSVQPIKPKPAPKVKPIPPSVSSKDQAVVTPIAPSPTRSRVHDTPPQLPSPRPSKPEQPSPQRVRDLPPLPTARRPELPVPSPAEPPPEGLYQFPWYHSSVDRTEATKRLKAMDKESGYLVRKSEKDPAMPYTLSIFFNDKVWNLHVRLKSDGTYAVGNEKPNEMTFQTVAELVHHHSSHDLLLAGSNGGTTRLLHPLRK